MTTTLLERMHGEDISREARQVRFSVTILTLITAIFFAIGWVAGRLWLGSVYCGFAVRQGWREGTKPRVPRQEPNLYG